MVNETILASIERARSAGATVLVKWDGGRSENVCTVLVTEPTIPFHFGEDTDDPIASLHEGITQFFTAHGPGG